MEFISCFFVLQNPAHLNTHGAGFCPRLRRPADVQDVLVPSGVARELVLEAENLPHPQAGHAGFQCLVDIEGAKMAVGARIEAGRFVVCDKTTVRLSVLFNPLQISFLRNPKSKLYNLPSGIHPSLFTGTCHMQPRVP